MAFISACNNVIQGIKPGEFVTAPVQYTSVTAENGTIFEPNKYCRSEGSAEAVLNVLCFNGFEALSLCSPAALPQRKIPWECWRFELGLALFLWSLHVISLILMRPHGPPVMCSGGRKGGGSWARSEGRDGGWTPVTPASLPTARLSRASRALLMFYLPGSLVHTLLRKYNGLSIINLDRVHNGDCMYRMCRIDEDPANCLAQMPTIVAPPEY